jgi:hypothetical protein
MLMNLRENIFEPAGMTKTEIEYIEELMVLFGQNKRIGILNRKKVSVRERKLRIFTG